MTHHITPTMRTVQTLLTTIAKEVWKISVFLTKLMVPILIGVKILSDIGGVDRLAMLLSPLMQWVGLPGETGFVWASAMVANLYVGLNVFVNLPDLQTITVAQATTLGLLMLSVHNIFMEMAVVKMAGVRLLFAVPFRIGGAFAIGFIFYMWATHTDTYQAPITVAMPAQDLEVDLIHWAINLVEFMIIVYGIVIAMVSILETLKLLKLTDVIVRVISPVLRLAGISRNAGEITVVGLILGLAFGGAYLIQEAKKGHIRHRDIVLSMAFLALCHALIEDTILLKLIGGDYWILLVYRSIISFLIVIILGLVVNRCSDKVFYAIFFKQKDTCSFLHRIF